jgi:hypothetical protein
MSNVMTDEAKAVAEVAKTAGEVVKAAEGLGSYLARVLGSIPDNLLGLAGGDWLEHKRRRHIAILEDNTARLLEGIRITEPQRLTEPSPSVLIPLLQAAVDESRPELQELWAALLANAMLDGGKRVRRDYFEAVRKMEPVDAMVLDMVGRHPGSGAIWGVLDADLQRLGFSPNDLTISLDKLESLHCLMRPVQLTAFGRGLLASCQVT